MTRQTTRYREREAVNREHRTRAAELHTRLQELLARHVRTDEAAAVWRASAADMAAEIRTWPAALAECVRGQVEARAAGGTVALAVQDAVDVQLTALAQGERRRHKAPRRGRGLASFARALPRSATAREQLLTWRLRLAEVKAMIRRGQLEPLSGVEARWTGAVVGARQAARLRFPTVAVALAQVHVTDLATITTRLAGAAEDVIAELTREPSGRYPRKEISE